VNYGWLPVQQTASPAGAGVIAGHDFFPKNSAWARIFAGSHRHAFCIPSGTKMNCNQIRPEKINPAVNGEHGGNPVIGKLRRKLGLTFVLSNPFKVPVAQLPAAPEADPAKKARERSI
jgi:hypothetical protein